MLFIIKLKHRTSNTILFIIKLKHRTSKRMLFIIKLKHRTSKTMLHIFKMMVYFKKFGKTLYRYPHLNNIFSYGIAIFAPKNK